MLKTENNIPEPVFLANLLTSDEVFSGKPKTYCTTGEEKYLISSFNDELTRQELWHYRLGHTAMGTLNSLADRKLVTGFDFPKRRKKYNVAESNFCSPCNVGKQVRAPFSKTNQAYNKTQRNCGDLFHIDLIGPIETLSIDGHNKWIMHITDDTSRYSQIYCLPTKDKL